MRRKFFSTALGMLTVCLILLMAAGLAEAEMTDAGGQYTYVLKDGGAVITGYVSAYNEHEYPLEPSGELSIPKTLDGHPVTGIGEAAFVECIFMTGVALPDGVTAIGDDAFLRCSGLAYVTIPDGVVRIGKWAFGNCTRLTAVSIPDGVTSIGENVFYGCYNLTDVVIPPSVAEIGENVFGQSKKVMLTVAEGSTAAQYAKDYGIPTVSGADIGEAMRKREGMAREWSYAIEDGGAVVTGAIAEPSGDIVIPGEIDGYPVTGIGYGAFAWDSEIISVSLPEGVTSIGRTAFDDCLGLERVNIPSTVTSIGGMAFTGCRALTDITIPQGVTVIEAQTFLGCTGLREVGLPSSLTAIGERAFSGCSGLTELVIPQGVVEIGAGAFYRLHYDGFTLIVTEGSYAAQYAEENGLPYQLKEE